MRSTLFALLFAACAPAGAQDQAPSSPPTQVLLGDLPAGADRQRVMEAARDAFAARKWAVSSAADGVLVARIHYPDFDSMLRVFLADGALRFVDGTVDRKGARSQVPERWLNYIRADLRRSLAATDRDAARRLRKLDELRAGGLISQAEYDSKRAEILKGL